MASATTVIGNLLLPPAVLVLLLLEALVLFRVRRGAAFFFTAVATLGLLLLSLPVVSDALCRGLERYPALQEEAIDASVGAIVVLAGGWTRSPEYGGGTLNAFSLERLRYGVRLHRRTGLPLMLVGGPMDRSQVPEAVLMARALNEEFNLRATWVEMRSRNTAENARNAAQILREAGVRHALLVTHAFHMGRALAQFDAQGFEVLPAPTRFCAGSEPTWKPSEFLPNANAFYWSYLALHEYLGQLWYAVRYGYVART